MTSPGTAITKADVAAWEKAIKQADRPLQIMDAKAKDYPYFKQAHTHFSTQREELLARVKSIGSDPETPQTTRAAMAFSTIAASSTVRVSGPQ